MYFSASMCSGRFSTQRTLMLFIGFAPPCLKISEPVPLLFSERYFAGQYFSKSPVDAVNSARNYPDKLLIFSCVCRKGDGCQSVPDVMIQIGDYLHPCDGEQMSLSDKVG